MTLGPLHIALVSLSVAITALSAPLRAAVTVTIEQPTAGLVVDNSVIVTATVSSTYQLQGVVATVGANTLPLVYGTACDPGCHAAWRGTLDLTGLPRGPQTLVVTASDVFADQGQAQTNFTIDRMPLATIAFPLEETVARPNVRIQATCNDDDPAGCSRLVVTVQDAGCGLYCEYAPVLFDGISSVDITVSLAAYEGKTMLVAFSSVDSAGQVTHQGRIVYVESSPLLTEVAGVSGRILDVQPDRILSLRDLDVPPSFASPNARLVIRTLATGTDEVIESGVPPLAGWLIPGGALYVAHDPAATYPYQTFLYSFRNSTLLPLGEVEQFSVVVKGDFALWGLGANLYRYTFSSQSLVLVTSAGTGADVTATGDVAYSVQVPSSTPTWGYDYHLFRWSAGVSTELTNSLGIWDMYPSAAQNNTVFARSAATNPPFSIVLHDGVQETTLATGFPSRPEPPASFQARQGWVAFLRPAVADGTQQAWLRSPNGVETQASFLGSPSTLGALSGGGRLTFYSPYGYGRLYLKLPGSPAKDIARDFGKSFWLGESGYYAIGRSLFRIEGSSVTGPLHFFPLVPCRAVDTRDPDGPLGGPALAAHGRRVIALVGTCGIPATAKSLAMNVTVVGATATGDLRFAAADDLVPPSSAINFAAGQTRASNTVVPLDSTGSLAVVNDASTAVTMVLDVSGWFE